jgi:MFS family permease
VRVARSDQFGALVERRYRLLFFATLTTSVGDSVARIALAFAVLDVGSVTDLGLVLAARQITSATVLVGGGVLSDRLPRDRVLVGASLVQGCAQAALAASVLAGEASLPVFIGLSVLYGMGDGLVIPAEAGLIPQTVSPSRLQQANALQGLSRSGVSVLGPALGGLLVVVTSPGWALALDSFSFFGCALLLAGIRITAREARTEVPFVRELRDGWREFTSRTWLWSTVVLFGFGNAFFMFWAVLGPAIAKEQLGGAGAWAAILTAGGIGAVAGGVAALRYRPSRPLAACVVWPLALVPELAVLALGAPTAVVAFASLVGGFGLAIHVALWFTVFQREVPEAAQSRVASYDAFGSVILSPFGAAIAGPLASAVGSSNALWIAAGAIVTLDLSMLAIPAVWTIGQPDPQPDIAAA